MKNECAIAYEATKEGIRKHADKNGITVAFEERYPYTVMYRTTKPLTLFEDQKDRSCALNLHVRVGGDTEIEIEGEGKISRAELRKLITGAENAADLFYRKNAEAGGTV